MLLGFKLNYVQPLARRDGATARYSAEASALFARMAKQPSDAEKTVYDNTIAWLKEKGGWEKRDEYQVFAGAPSQADAVLGWKGFANAAINNGSPSWNKATGFTTGAASSITTNMVPNTLPKFLENNASLTYQSGTDSRNSAMTDGALTAQRTYLFGKNGTADTSGSINSNNAVSTSGGNAKGTDAVGIKRTSSTDYAVLRNGTPAALGSGASEALSVLPIVLGKNGSTYYPNNYLHVAAGGAMTALEDSYEHDALKLHHHRMGSTVPNAVGTATLTQASSATLPDGANPQSPGVGMPCTGLAIAPDGTLWIGNGVIPIDATQDDGISHLNAAGDTVLAQYTYADLGLLTGSVQGIAIEPGASDSEYTIWFINKATSNGAYMVKIDQDGTLLDNDLLPNSDSNGLAWDAKRSQLILSRDSGAISWLAPSDLTATGKTYNLSSLPYPLDHLAHDPARDILFGSYGQNGGDGSVARVYVGEEGDCRLNNWRMTEVQAIEGIAIDGNTLVVVSDQYTHQEGDPDLNIIYRFSL